MERLSIPLTEDQKKAVKVKAAQTGLPVTEIVRRFLFAWLADRLPLPEQGEWEYSDKSYSVEHWNE